MNFQLSNIDKIVLLGGGALLVAIARWCQSKDISVFVVTSPRHSQELIENNQTLEDLLVRDNITFLVTKDIESSTMEEFLGDLSNAFCLSIAAAWTFKENILKSLFKNKLLNLHGARLPQNRGGGGFSWQIMMGNRLGFCQLHLMDTGQDTGDLIRSKEFLYPPYCRKPIDYEKLYFKENFAFVLRFIEDILSIGICLPPQQQTEYFSTSWPRLSTADNAWIDWNDGAENLERFICAFDDPYEGAKTLINGEKIYIKNVCVDYSDPQFHPYQVGIIFRKNENWISVCTKGGTLIIETILDEKGNSIFNSLNVGDRFYTTSDILDQRIEKITYSPNGKE